MPDIPPERLRLERLRDELQSKVQGDLLWDQMSRMLFSTDASLYQQTPLGVVLPETRVDLLQAVRTAAKYRVPILPRGGGTSLAGQAVTRGLVIDDSKHMNRLLEVNPQERWARVELGIVLDNLNHALGPHGLFFAPDVATASRATLGGMLGNNSAGVRSVRYGRTVEHVLELEVVLATGEELHLTELNARELDSKCGRQDREGEIYRSVRDLLRRHRGLIQEKYPNVPRRSGGYTLDSLLDEDHFNLAKLVVGSEGTLAFMTEARVSLEVVPAVRMVAVLHFQRLAQAIDAVKFILRVQPTAVEIIDGYGLQLAKSNPEASRLVGHFVSGDPEAVLMVEFSGASQDEIEGLFAHMKADREIASLSYHLHEAWTPEAQAIVWGVRKNALGLMLGMKGDAKPLPFIEDACVPIQHLSAYIQEVLDICKELERPVAMYAHASVGVIHVRPILNLKQAEDVEIMKEISDRTFELVVKYGGFWSGEHGDGLVRSFKNREFFGNELYEAFRQIKHAFDPLGVMNPGKIVESHDIGEDLRIHPDYKTTIPETHFRFRADMGFDRAVEMCTGVGHCRKTLVGTMCPSYMATRDEEHSTRGRANALRLAMSGQLGEGALTGRRLYEVMDLCLECKACKSECPSNVDMARIKAEFLSHYYKEQGWPLGKRLIARTRQMAELASRMPRLSNLAAGNPVTRLALEWFAGFDRRRTLPRYARETLASWFRSRSNGTGGEPITLFADTFTNFHEPHIGKAAVALLESLGFRVHLFSAGCCGRPAISSGDLQGVRKGARGLIASLSDVAAGSPVIVLEPSCLSTLRDDYPDLSEDEESCRKVTDRCLSLEEFLTRPEVQSRLEESLGSGPDELIYHGHCQQKSLIGLEASKAMLDLMKASKLTVLDAGCCGMAGAFGYEKEHYEISEKIGSLRLFPALEEAADGCLIVAPGFSCRSQIKHFTGRTALHPVEVLARCVR